MDRGSASIPTGLIAACLVTGLGPGVGCGGPSTEGGMDSPVPAARLTGIRDAARQGDTSAVPALIESLDSDDIAVRTAAIDTLERLTGTRRGYEPDAALPARRAAIDRWVAAVPPSTEVGP